MPDQRSRSFARLLRLPVRALEASAHVEPRREHIRDRAPPDDTLQGVPIEQNCSRHGLQARSSGGETLASPRWKKSMPKVVLGVKFTDGIEVAKEQVQT